jgi:hypothetical protein
MRTALRDLVRQRYTFRCGYCGITEQETGARLTIDHYHPIAHGGTDDFDNLVYACHACNEFKGDWWHPGTTQRILHPLQDDLAQHYVEQENGTLHPLTAEGIFHIDQLQLNRPPLVAHRVQRRREEQLAQREADVVARFQGMEEQVRHLLHRVSSLSQEVKRLKQRGKRNR